LTKEEEEEEEVAEERLTWLELFEVQQVVQDQQGSDSSEAMRYDAELQALSLRCLGGDYSKQRK
jgi:hypothetical protein